MFGSKPQYLKQWLKRAEEQQIFVVFLVIDTRKKGSILKMPSVGRDIDGNITMNSYIDSFPFPYYVILQDISNLPQVLADALRQWFEAIQKD